MAANEYLQLSKFECNDKVYRSYLICSYVKRRIMKKKKDANPIPTDIEAYCHYCGTTVGQISERTDEKVHAIYDCPRSALYP
jgi:hypothetical protein